MARPHHVGAKGLYLLPNGVVVVAFGSRHIAIPSAQYRANGYRPLLEKLALKQWVVCEPTNRRELGAPLSPTIPAAGPVRRSTSHPSARGRYEH
jgi:hypothetical protein